MDENDTNDKYEILISKFINTFDDDDLYKEHIDSIKEIMSHPDSMNILTDSLNILKTLLRKLLPNKLGIVFNCRKNIRYSHPDCKT